MNKKITLSLLPVLLCLSMKSLAQCDTIVPNIGFEDGNFTNWHCYTGTFSTPGEPYLSCTNVATPPINGRHNIMSGTGTDLFGGFPVVDPGGGTYAARVGYDTTGARAERIRYYVHVPAGASTFDLVYKFAIDLENPGHAPSATALV